MGTYLSTPVLDKGVESGEALDDPTSPVAWSLVDMQGWRKSMEDAHVADTNVEVPPHLLMDSHEEDGGRGKVFGVFDGHGGAEVARFCQLYLVDVLTKQQTWVEENPVTDDSRDPAASAVGQALIDAFHALDRMIDDRSRREELIRLRTEKPRQGDRRSTDSHPIPQPKVVQRLKPVTPVSREVDEAKAKEHNPEEKKQETPEKSSEVDDTKIHDEDTEAAASESTDPENDGDGQSDEDSTEVVGKEEAAELDQEDEEQESNGDESASAVEADPEPSQAPKAAAPTPGIVATIIQNGRQICNLPDHPIHAGCTAIVAVLIGRTLTVANAGDSRAVLCRVGGRTEALSFDHKPLQDREMARITTSGGFVNQFGRVNGNLNLSRSIGDLKYKQIPGLSPSEQMITAEPDIIQVTLHPQDEFFILGCDGIWDCLTNEQAVKYVRDRIDKKTPTEIGIEMLDEIISEDPRATQGIGGDNMTIMIIDLQPSKRPYR